MATGAEPESGKIQKDKIASEFHHKFSEKKREPVLAHRLFI